MASSGSVEYLEVSRSGFYAWASRPPIGARNPRRRVDRGDRRGPPAVARAPTARHGCTPSCAVSSIAALANASLGLMRASGLVGVHARRRWRRRPRGHGAGAGSGQPVTSTPRGPDQLWAADVTQFRTGEGWLDLAAVIDLWSRRVVGWSMGNSPNSELVTDALMMAFQRRRPDRRVVHHSDRGAACTSLAFSQRVVALQLDQSFGSTGDCYDNAAVEAFWATLKRELAWIHHTHDLEHTNRASQRTLRLHRRLLQPSTDPTSPRQPEPRRLRTTMSRLKPTSIKPGQLHD